MKSTTFEPRQTMVTAVRGSAAPERSWCLHDEIARGALPPGDSLAAEQTLGDQSAFTDHRTTGTADSRTPDLSKRRQASGHRPRPTPSRRTRVRLVHGRAAAIEFETEVGVIELAIRTVPTAIADHWAASASCMSCGLRRDAEPQKR